MAQASRSVAIYWKFENLRQPGGSGCGRGTYLASRFRPQDEGRRRRDDRQVRLSLRPIAIQPRFRQLGVLQSLPAISAAGCHQADRSFPPGANAKRLEPTSSSAWMMEDMVRFSHIRTIIVVSGDSDYITAVYKVRLQGERWWASAAGVGRTNTGLKLSVQVLHEALLAPAVPATRTVAQAATGWHDNPAAGEPVSSSAAVCS